MADFDVETLTRVNELLRNIEGTLSSVGTKLAGLLTSAPGQMQQFADTAVKAGDASKVAGEQATKAGTGFGTLTSSVGEVNKRFADYKAQSASSLGISNQFITQLENSIRKWEMNGKVIDSNVDSMQSLQGQVEMLAQGGGLAASVILGLGDALGKYNKTSQEVIGADTSSKLVENTKQGLDKINTLFSRFGVNSGLLEKVLAPFKLVAGGLESGIEELVKESAGVRTLENSLMGLMGQFAGFRDISRIDFTSNLDSQLIKIVEQNTAVAQSTNLASEEVSKYAQNLMELPGAYNQTINLTGVAGGNMALLEGAIRIARGTTGQYKDVLEDLTLQFRQFNETDGKSLDLMSRTYDLSQRLGIGFKDLNGIISGVVKQFATLGDNMLSSVNLVGALTKAMQQTGLGIEPTKAIIESITQSIGNMGLAQKAFLSQQTGGAGGLRGAFEIDMLMRQGKVDEVYSKMEQALRGQFGKVTTLEEGSRSDAGAAELTRQVQFLTQGPFGAVVKSTDQAYRLLEAFKTAGPGGIDTEAIGRETGGAMADALSADEVLQTKQTDALIGIQNIAGQLLQEQQVGNVLLLRQIGKQLNLDTSALYNEARSEAVGLAGDTGRWNMGTQSPVSAVLETAQDAIRLIGDYATGTGIGGANGPETLIETPLPGPPRLPQASREGATTLPGQLRGPESVMREIKVVGEIDINIHNPNGTITTTTATLREASEATTGIKSSE